MRRATFVYLALLLCGGFLGYRMTRSSTPARLQAPVAEAHAESSSPTGVEDAARQSVVDATAAIPAAAAMAPATEHGPHLSAPAGPRHEAFGEGNCPDSLFDAEGAMTQGRDEFLEQRMQWLLEDYDVPEGAIVVLDPRTGELLAAAGHRAPGVDDRHLAVEPRFPAASLFKIVSSAALLQKGLTPSSSICYHGGKRDVMLRQLEDNAARDRACAGLDRALASSLNVPMAKWADRLLDVGRLAEVARRFGFAAPAEHAALRCYGTAVLPDERLGFARTAAGFGEVRVSAWHAAVLAALVANRGVLPSSLGRDPAHPPRLLPRAVAEQLAQMMTLTVREGTARRAFHERRRPVLGTIEVAGKTGSLVDGEGDDWGEVTWFAGFAPADNPRVAVAAMIVNSPHWRIRASYAAREALRTALLHTEPYRPTQDPGVREHRGRSRRR
ncbi:MAG: penicillin-binding transpeptidase domain-containing protein [Pseudomonadota bacterium]